MSLQDPLFPPTPIIQPRKRQALLAALTDQVGRVAHLLPDQPRPREFVREVEHRAQYRAPWLFEEDPQAVAAVAVEAALLGLTLDWMEATIEPAAGGRLTLRVLSRGMTGAIVRTVNCSMLLAHVVHRGDDYRRIEHESGPQILVSAPPRDQDEADWIFVYATANRHRENRSAVVTRAEAEARLAQRKAPADGSACDLARLMCIAAAAEPMLAEMPQRWPAVQRCRRVIDRACGDGRLAPWPIGETVPEAARARDTAREALNRLNGLARQPKWLRDQLADITQALRSAA
ncbi:recombinase RecT [Falsiroseomonas selenitidurans]|uniref:Uncharacterized protein n=1 Tax=Falsiroseomonas selenitidurans TaxID=2716335 RepID=A0ABX1DZ37_9PROT|nr:recombinase RecT [Falsiroseomonas selenitidurans]NKC30170.1 hypothetical protein [Falsiroseomonas selenitidurans]